MRARGRGDEGTRGEGRGRAHVVFLSPLHHERGVRLAAYVRSMRRRGGLRC